MSIPVRVRFAPSPTGLLHIGNARTAIYNYVFARQHGGRFILRIEDTDAERSSEDSALRIQEDLRWLGLDWDEGPDTGGALGPYRQSLRSGLYEEAARGLIRDGKAYRCFCSSERLEVLRQAQLAGGTMPRYDGLCRSLSTAEATRREEAGERPVLRFRVDRGTIGFDDLIHGAMRFEGQGIGDFVLLRSDGTAAYNFACVVDDHWMGISHVIRGEDHLSNTPRQVLLYLAQGWTPPVFGHHSLILGSDHSPLSKRHGATAVSQYREEGFLAEALLCYLLRLGSASSSGEEALPIEKIIPDFRLETLSKAGPVHDPGKLEWLNSQFIRRLTDEALADRLKPLLEREGIETDRNGGAYLAGVAGALKENLTVLSQVRDYLGVFFEERFGFDAEAEAILHDPSGREVLGVVLRVLEEEPVGMAESWGPLFSRLQKETGRRGKAFYGPLRAAITGRMKGPELVKVLPLLGPARVAERLRKALAS
jgi:nondiscriminating glutamyl-tRNA synthetase